MTTGKQVGQSRARYRLSLVAPANETREQSDRRLRAALKALGRQFNLKCEKATGLDEPKHPEQGGA